MNNPSLVSVKNPRLNEEYRKYTHPSGLDIYIFPKKLSTSFAIFGTKYGSIHNKFRTIGETEWKEVPDGIAHFLEHKLFVCEDGSDAFEHFSDFGADANAYTSFNKTCYLFSCTDRFEESLAELLDFVTHPFFTEESVANEIGIISEEIRMYSDSPSDRCLYGMLEGMYKNHSIRRNICGSYDSISKITPDLLYECYNKFYRLSNMLLVVCGDISDETVLSIADLHLPVSNQKDIEIECYNENADEPDQAHKAYIEQHLQVSKPIFKIGFKDTDIPSNGKDRQKKEATAQILYEMIFASSNSLYTSLIENDMILPPLSFSYTCAPEYAYGCVSAQAENPKSAYEHIFDFIESLRTNGLNKADFDRAKKVLYAEEVKSYDSTESIADNLFNFAADGLELLSYTDTIDSVSFEDVTALFEKSFKKECTTLSVVFPIENL